MKRRIINWKREARALFKERTEMTEEIIVQRSVDENWKKLKDMIH